MPFTNAEKQERFRKKEALKKYADEVFISCIRNYPISVNRDVLQARLNEFAELPSGWTDEDLRKAEKKIYNLQFDVMGFGNSHLLENDIGNGRKFSKEFMISDEPRKFIEKEKKIQRKARELANQIINLFRLSDCPVSDQVAILAEVLRWSGRLLIDENEVPKSNASALAMATLTSQYQRPDWFLSRLATVIVSNLGEDAGMEFGKLVTKYSSDIMNMPDFDFE